MAHPIEPSILRILNSKGQTIGTGFLVSKNLAVTCAHVAISATMDGENRIRVQFTGEKQSIYAKVLDECFDIDRDVAILQINEVPAEIAHLYLGRASESRLKNDLYTYGYAIAAGEQGIGGLGTFIRQDGNFVQFRMHEADHGHSGAPLYDDKRGVVVGMIKKGKDMLGRNAETTYAISTETIWQVCPQLKPPPPPSQNLMVEGINLLPYDYDQRIENFLAEYLGSEKHPVPFGGRDNALHILDNWLAGDMPYLILAAPAGRGKSALLVRWLAGLQTREDLALAFVPISIRFGTNMERVFYGALAARLAFLHGDDVPANSETSTAVYRGLVNDYLSKPLVNGRALLIVLDGLDEAADWQAGADFLPVELPAGVRVVVSARFLAGDVDPTPWLRRLNWRKSQASAPLLIPLDRAGLVDVLLKMGCPLDELSRNVDIVKELHLLSEGDPLLVRLYVSDLWIKGDEVARLKPEDLADIEPGYRGYFEHWWQDQEKLWGIDTPMMRPHVQTLLNLLACALSGLTREDLVRLAPQELNRFTLDHAFKILQRFVIGDGGNQGYTFSHPKLGQYFWEALTPFEREQVEERFLIWGGQTLQEFIDGKRNSEKKDEVPAYIVRNYGAHLARAKWPIEMWLPLIQHQEWAQAWFSIEGAYGGYLQDVQRVWERCRTLDHQATATGRNAAWLGAQVRCALIEASLHSLAASIPAELIWPLVRDSIWTLTQAWVVIRQMPESRQQIQAILGLLPYLEDRQLLEALTTVRAIRDERDRALLLSELTKRLPEISGEALTTARAIQNEEVRASVLNTLAQQISEETLEQLLVDAQAIHHEGGRTRVFNTLAQRMPEGDLEQLLAATLTIQSEEFRAKVLNILAQRMSEEELGQLLVAVRAIKGEKVRANVLGILLQRMPEGDLEQLLTAARAIQDEEVRANLLSDLAERMLDRELVHLLVDAQNIRNEWVRANTLIVLVQRMPEVDLEQLLSTVQAIQSGWCRAWVLNELIQRMPEVSGEALAAARAIQDEENRVRVLSELAKRISTDWLTQLLIDAQTIQDEENRASVLSALAQRMPEVNGASLTVVTRAIQDEKVRSRVLINLTQRMPEEELEQLLAAARAIQDETIRASILIRLAQRMPEVIGEVLAVAQIMLNEGNRTSVWGELVQQIPEVAGEALIATRATQNEENRARLLRVLAQQMPEGGLVQLLIDVQLIKDEENRANVLSALARRMPEGELEQLLTAVRAIQDERVRVSVLTFLAQRIPEKGLAQLLIDVRLIQDEENRANVLSALARRIPEGELEQLLTTARAIQDEEVRVSVLRVLAGRMPEGGLAQLLVDTQAIQHEDHQAAVLSELAERMPEGELRQLLAATRIIQYEVIRIFVLSALSQRMPEEKYPAQLLAAVSAIPDKGGRALRALAGRMSKRELDKLLVATRAIEHKGDRARILCNLAQQIPEVSREALAAARAIEDEGDRASIFRALAQQMSEGELAQLLIDVRLIQDEGNRANVMSALAQRMPTEELEQVLAATRNIQDDEIRANMLSTLVQRMPEVSVEALTAAQAIRDEWVRAKVLSTLVQHIPKRELEQLLDAARTIQDEWVRVRMLSELAQRIPEVIGEAITTMRAIQDDWIRARVLSEWVQRMPEMTGEALAAARVVKDEGVRASVLSDLAWRMPEGELKQLLVDARAIHSEEARTKIFGQLAQRMPEVDLEKLLKTVQSIQHEDVRADLLSTIIRRMPEGKLGRLLVAARAIRDEGIRARILSELAQRIPEVIGEALTTTQAIRDEWVRAKVLSEWVQRMPEIADEALAAAQPIQNDRDPAHYVLSNLAQHPSEVTDEALAVARTIQDKEDRASTLRTLVQPLINIDKIECYSWVEITISDFSLRTRANLFWDISALLPVLLHLGADGLDREILLAVRDVSIWWK